jgi:hypothetical protein
VQERANRTSLIGLIVLSFTALTAVLSGYLPNHPPQADEGTAAHIFQLSMVALLPTGLAFLATADWTRPARAVRRLAIPAVAVVLAFAALYYLEHVYYPAHY